MRFETLHNLRVPKIGFGTWTIGGYSNPDPAGDDQSLRALRSALELGYTHFDTAERYAAGHAEELLGQAIRDARIPREKLIITTKVDPMNLRYDDVLGSCEGSLRRLGMDYLDLYLIHWPNADIPLTETFQALNKLVHEGKVRNLGVSNFNLRLLQKAIPLSETPLLTNQVSYSLPDRTVQENGVLDYCQKNDILLTAYTPLNRRNIKSNGALQAIAHTRGVTREQIALAWLTTQPRVIAIPMSMNPRHQAENLAAGDLVLSDEEMQQLDRPYSSSQLSS